MTKPIEITKVPSSARREGHWFPNTPLVKGVLEPGNPRAQGTDCGVQTTHDPCWQSSTCRRVVRAVAAFDRASSYTPDQIRHAQDWWRRLARADEEQAWVLADELEGYAKDLTLASNKDKHGGNDDG